jgi:hypothetical protein
MEISELAVEQKRQEIAQGMSALGRRLEKGDDSELLHWVIRDVLACVHRPLRHHAAYGGSGAPIPSSAKPLILDWIELMQLEGIATVITFMHDRDLDCYRNIDFDGATLLDALPRYGLRVCRLPWEDPAHSKSDLASKQAKVEEMREKALRAFDQLVKPVALMCSAGVDRSAPAGAFIFESLRARGGMDG